jgi:methyl-accepting chemotaxis protein
MPKLEVNKKAKPFRSLRGTLVITFYALVSVILIILGFLSLYFNFQAHQQAIAGEQHLVAQGAANTVKSFIQEKSNILKTAVSFGKPLIIPPEEKKLVLERLLGVEPAFRQLSLLNAEKEELVKVSRLSERASSRLTERTEHDFFSQLSQGKTYISSVYIDEVTSEPMIIMAVPITDVFDDFKGTLLAEVNLKFMWDLVASINIGETGVAYVVNREGDLIAFKDISRVLRGENLSYLKEVDEFIRGDELTHKSTADILKGIQGNYVVANHAHLGEPDWAVVTELPIEEAYAPLIHQIILSTLIMLLILGSASAAVIYVSRRITNPIIDLRDAAVEIGKGKLETKIDVKTNDEIGELAQTFNQMVVTLKEFYETLEGKVQERTRELEEARASLEVRVKARTEELQELTDRQEETIEERTKEIKERMGELERFHRLAVGRELKMIEIKKEMQKLKKEMGEHKEKHGE